MLAILEARWQTGDRRNDSRNVSVENKVSPLASMFMTGWSDSASLDRDNPPLNQVLLSNSVKCTLLFSENWTVRCIRPTTESTLVGRPLGRVERRGWNSARNTDSRHPIRLSQSRYLRLQLIQLRRESRQDAEDYSSGYEVQYMLHISDRDSLLSSLTTRAVILYRI